MNTLLAIGGTIAALVAIVFLALKSATKSGRKEGEAVAKAEIQEELRKVEVAHEAVKKEELNDVAEIRDRLDSDPAYAERVRDRFTRD